MPPTQRVFSLRGPDWVHGVKGAGNSGSSASSGAAPAPPGTSTPGTPQVTSAVTIQVDTDSDRLQRRVRRGDVFREWTPDATDDESVAATLAPFLEARPIERVFSSTGSSQDIYFPFFLRPLAGRGASNRHCSTESTDVPSISTWAAGVCMCVCMCVCVFVCVCVCVCVPACARALDTHTPLQIYEGMGNGTLMGFDSFQMEGGENKLGARVTRCSLLSSQPHGMCGQCRALGHPRCTADGVRAP
jgi:hypothetical protein